MPGVRELLDALVVARRRLSRAADRQLREPARGSSSNTSISGDTFRAARSATMRRIATGCCRRALARMSRRAADRRSPRADASSIGDTPLDVACAARRARDRLRSRPAATASRQLRAAGADVVFEDLSDTDARRLRAFDRSLLDQLVVKSNGGSASESNRASPRERGATDFEDREGHRAPFTSAFEL